MARKRPPQHRADVPGVFIPRSDSSLDVDRVAGEKARLVEAGLETTTHPVERYYAGETRYDLAAPEVLFGVPTFAGSYFRHEMAPERWLLRRLDWQQWHRCFALIETGQFHEAQLLAARFGVAGVENLTLKLDGAAAGTLTHEDCQRIHDLDSSLLSALGFAVWRYSRDLDEAEKKA